MLLSVITVTLNSAETIEKTIRSVKSQTYKHIELVVVDGGSKDGTFEMAQEFGADIFLQEKDDGIYHAMQKGADISNGRLIFFLNSGDQFYDEHVVEKAANTFKNEGPDAVFGDVIPYDNGKFHNHPSFNPGEIVSAKRYEKIKSLFYGSMHHQGIFYKREIFDRCKIYNENGISGEYALHVNAFVNHGFKFKYLAMPITKFELGGKSTRSFSSEISEFEYARQIIRESYYQYVGFGLWRDKHKTYWLFPKIRDVLTHLKMQTNIGRYMTKLFRRRFYEGY